MMLADLEVRLVKQVIASLRRHASRLRAGLMLGLIGQAMRLYSRELTGALPAPVALVGTVGLVLALAMVWTGIEGFMHATVQGFDLCGGEEPPEQADGS